MDLSVLPNNNHPDKFLQLDVKSLMRNSALLQASLVRFPGGNYPAAQHWQNLVYSQVRSGSTRICGWGLAVFPASATSSFVRKGYRQQSTGSLLTLAIERGFLSSSREGDFLWSLDQLRELSPPFVFLHAPASLTVFFLDFCLALPSDVFRSITTFADKALGGTPPLSSGVV